MSELTNHGEFTPITVMNGTLAIRDPRPNNLTIHNEKGATLVTISFEDGALTFGPDYTPDEAARVFWNALSEDYRNMLEWKAAHSTK